MGIIKFNSDGFSAMLSNCGFWDRLKDETRSYDEMIDLIPDNFSLDDEMKMALCEHCGDEFNINRGLCYLVYHLQNNHAGYIITPKVDVVI